MGTQAAISSPTDAPAGSGPPSCALDLLTGTGQVLAASAVNGWRALDGVFAPRGGGWSAGGIRRGPSPAPNAVLPPTAFLIAPSLLTGRTEPKLAVSGKRERFEPVLNAELLTGPRKRAGFGLRTRRSPGVRRCSRQIAQSPVRIGVCAARSPASQSHRALRLHWSIGRATRTPGVRVGLSAEPLKLSDSLG